MPRNKRFTFLCNKDEQRLIEQLAASLARSKSDAVRFVVIRAARELEKQPTALHLSTRFPPNR